MKLVLLEIWLILGNSQSYFINNSLYLLIFFLVICSMALNNKVYFGTSRVPMYFTTNVLILFFVVLSSLLIINSINLLWTWFGIELQTFCILVIIAQNKVSLKAKQASFEYFIYSAMFSILFFTGVIMSPSIIHPTSFSYFIITFCLFFKLAIVPCHFWIYNVYEGSNVFGVFIISTFPKLSLLIYIFHNYSICNSYFIIIGIFTFIICSLSALNQIKINKFIAASGSANMGLFLTYIGISEYFCVILFFLIYSMALFVFLIIIENKCYIIEALEVPEINNIILLCLSVFSFAGIPPLLGFLSKYIIISELWNLNYTLACYFIVFSSLILTFGYLRLVIFITRVVIISLRLSNRYSFGKSYLISILVNICVYTLCYYIVTFEILIF